MAACDMISKSSRCSSRPKGAGREGRRAKAKVDNTLQDLQNSSYPTKAEFSNCFIIHSKYFQTLKGENELYF